MLFEARPGTGSISFFSIVYWSFVWPFFVVHVERFRTEWGQKFRWSLVCFVPLTYGLLASFRKVYSRGVVEFEGVG